VTFHSDNIAVLPEWHRQGIGRALLEEIHQAFRQSGDDIQATVPETNLPVQLFLRDAGYKAVRVVPGCFGSEDGYVMQRSNG
jgi:ribosomal protein S18 acetylase RimI-like enzyme